MKFIFLALLSMISLAAMTSDEITAFQYDAPPKPYDIPASSRFTTKRPQDNAPDIVYYLSKPISGRPYPLVIFCEGSANKEDVCSVVHVHRYYLDEFKALGTGVLTVERWGVDGNKVDIDELMANYTCTQRWEDHCTVIRHLKQNPPKDWNGKIIFFGASEGGRLVTRLTTDFIDDVIATINWSGAGHFSWKEELWAFIQKKKENNPEEIKNHPECRDLESYDAKVREISTDPKAKKEFLKMTYKYLDDAFKLPEPIYPKMCKPFLAVVGVDDCIKESADEFFKKAKEAKANITYRRIEGMGHYVRKNSEAVKETFCWLKEQLDKFNAPIA